MVKTTNDENYRKIKRVIQGKMQIKIQPGVSEVDSDIFLTVFLYGSNLWKCHSPGKWTVLFDLPDIRTRFHDLKQDHRTDDRSDTGNGTADSHKPKSGIFYDHTTHGRTGCNTEDQKCKA